jgi:DNA-binding beta-propeller fold protein YncE
MSGKVARKVPHWNRTPGLLLLAGVVLSSLWSGVIAQPKIPRVKHVFTLRGVSDRLPFGTVGDISFEPRFREVYLTDSDRNEVWILDSEGFLLHRFGRDVGLRNPGSVAVFPDGRILVVSLAESGDHLIRTFNARGSEMGFFPPHSFAAAGVGTLRAFRAGIPEWAESRYMENAPAEGGRWYGDGADLGERAWRKPSDRETLGRIQMGPDRMIYVVDSEMDRILAYTPDGKVKKEFGREMTTADRYGGKHGVSASGLAIRRDGTVLATDLTRGTVVVFDPEGKEIGTIGRRGGGDGLLSFPVDVAVDTAGHVYVADRHRHTILVYDWEGRYLYEFGGFGGRDGHFFYPTAICVDDVDRLWITDMSKRVQVFQVPQNGNGTKYLNGNGLNGHDSRVNGKRRMVRR